MLGMVVHAFNLKAQEAEAGGYDYRVSSKTARAQGWVRWVERLTRSQRACMTVVIQWANYTLTSN